jgi:hypothetical protein
MNERIRQLLSQAGVHYEVLPKDTVYEKFAELIVRECARIGELKEQGYEEYDPDLSVGWYMKQHFGVKE